MEVFFILFVPFASQTAPGSQKVPGGAPDPSKPQFWHPKPSNNNNILCSEIHTKNQQKTHTFQTTAHRKRSEKKRAFRLPRGPFEWLSQVVRPTEKNVWARRVQEPQERQNRKGHLPNANSHGAAVLTLCVLNPPTLLGVTRRLRTSSSPSSLA